MYVRRVEGRVPIRALHERKVDRDRDEVVDEYDGDRPAQSDDVGHFPVRGCTLMCVSSVREDVDRVR